MYQLQGFFNYSPLIDNRKDQVAMFGEVSSDSLTFAKDKLYHTNEVAPQTQLVVFSTQNEDGYTEVPAPLAKTVLQAGQYLLERALAGTLSSDASLFLASFRAEFNNVLSEIDSGEILSDGDHTLPEWVSFRVVDHPENNKVTVWLADDSFRMQYMGYHIDVIPPIVPVDDFMKDPLEVRRMLDAYNFVEKMDDAQAKRGDYPYTQLIVREYDYVNPVDKSFKVPSIWLVIIYGRAGVNPDVIKEAIIEHVLDNSEYPRDDWVDILPDLFLRTEFVMTPFWTTYAVPNRELQAGLYSPTVHPASAVALLKQTTVGDKYTDAWIEQHYEVSNLLYKSLAFGVVGHPENRDGITSFYDQFKEYIIVTNDSADFNRMPVSVQEFYVKLGELTRVAEELDGFETLPVGVFRLTRDAIEYVAFVHENIAYLMVTKQQLEALTTPST